MGRFAVTDTAAAVATADAVAVAVAAAVAAADAVAVAAAVTAAVTPVAGFVSQAASCAPWLPSGVSFAATGGEGGEEGMAQNASLLRSGRPQ